MTVSTIAAISTPVGRGAIGIVRISGPETIPLIGKIFIRKEISLCHQERPVSRLKSHHIYYGNIADPETNLIVDEVLVLVMRAPKSYTREDVVEIQSHAGPAVIKKILQIVIKNGADHAEPGEFTKKAFLNGRIDLSQAEAVEEIISADSENAAGLAIGHLNGSLSHRISEVNNELLAIISHMEAEIEFSDEAENEEDRAGYYTEKIEVLLHKHLRQLIDHHESGQLIKEGYRVAICGKPNVGKSSLLNRMIDEDRVIVTDIAGTTRDTIEEKILINGHLVRICDMAGIHDNGDNLENIGIKRAWEYIERADLVIFVLDLGRPVDSIDLNIFRSISDKNIIITKNKVDLVENFVSMDFPEEFNCFPSVEISAKLNLQVDKLRKMIAMQVDKVTDLNPATDVAPNFRQTQILKDMEIQTYHALDAIKDGLPIDVVVENLYGVSRKTEKILGRGIETDVLELVFKNFCIGK